MPFWKDLSLFGRDAELRRVILIDHQEGDFRANLLKYLGELQPSCSHSRRKRGTNGVYWKPEQTESRKQRWTLVTEMECLESGTSVDCVPTANLCRFLVVDRSMLVAHWWISYYSFSYFINTSLQFFGVLMGNSCF